MTTEIVQILFRKSHHLKRYHCHVCGGWTDKDMVLSEGKQELGPKDDGTEREYRTIRVCGECLRAGEGTPIDQRLDLYAQWVDAEAALTRALIGRLRVPSHAEWHAAEDLAWRRRWEWEKHGPDGRHWNGTSEIWE